MAYNDASLVNMVAGAVSPSSYVSGYNNLQSRAENVMVGEFMNGSGGTWSAAQGLSSVVGDVTGYNGVMAGSFGVDRQSQTLLSTSDSWSQGLMGGSQLILTGTGLTATIAPATATSAVADDSGWVSQLQQQQQVGPASGGGGVKEGSFSVIDWGNLPEHLQPTGPLNLLPTGSDELIAAQRAKALSNDTLRDSLDLNGVPMDIHEIQPMKFGGSPTALENKTLLPRDVHQQIVTPFWNQLQRDIGPYVTPSGK